ATCADRNPARQVSRQAPPRAGGSLARPWSSLPLPTHGVVPISGARSAILPSRASFIRRSGSRVGGRASLLDGTAVAEIAWGDARPPLECAGEVRRIGVPEGTRDLADLRSPVLQHPLRCRAARPLDDLRVGEPLRAESSLEGPDTRPHRCGDEVD